MNSANFLTKRKARMQNFKKRIYRKHLVIYLYIILKTLMLNAQNFSNHTSDSATSFWLNHQLLIFKELGDVRPFDVNQKYQCRIVFHGQVISNLIDIWSDDGLIYNSEVIFYTKEYVPIEEEATDRYMLLPKFKPLDKLKK